MLRFLSQLAPKIHSNVLRETIETYQLEQQANKERLNDLLSDFEVAADINKWRVMDEFISEWKEDINTIRSEELKNVGFIMSVQRILHLNIALFEFQNLLTGFVRNSEMQRGFELLLNQEIGNDQSFTAIAEGSLFKERLDSKVKRR